MSVDAEADLIERLRDVLRNWTNVTEDEQSVIREAADAIAALRAENEALRGALARLTPCTP